MSFIIGDVPLYSSTGAPMQNHPGSRKGKDIMKGKPGKKAIRILQDKLPASLSAPVATRPEG
jgi:hypothetical protein